MDTDASNTRIGLSQDQNGMQVVTMHFSNYLSQPDRNYCVTGRYLLEVVKSTTRFQHIFAGEKMYSEN